MTEKLSQLSSAVRFPVLLKYIGQVCLVPAARNMVPMAVAPAAAKMGLPEDSRGVCCYRGDRFLLPSDDTTFQKGDEVVIITHSKHLPKLREKWYPSQTEAPNSENKKKKKEQP